MNKCRLPVLLRIVVFFAAFAVLSVGRSEVAAHDLGGSWTKNSTVAEDIQSYVEQISKKRSANYVPPEARVAVFDLGGTIMCDTYPRPFDWLMLRNIVDERGIRLPLEARSTVREINETLWDEKPDDMDNRAIKAEALAYKGFTADEFVQRVENLKKTAALGFSGMTYGEAFRQPMCELIEYLKENDFKVYIVCDTERMTARALASGKLGIDGDRIIGTDFSLVASTQGEQASDTYSMRTSDRLVLDGRCETRNVKMNKVTAIMREIGRQPVLAFGNSLDDSSMLNFVMANNPYKSMSFMVINDDNTRDYSDEIETDEVRRAATFNGWHRISVKNDFAVLYGKNVTKSRKLR